MSTQPKLLVNGGGGAVCGFKCNSSSSFCHHQSGPFKGQVDWGWGHLRMAVETTLTKDQRLGEEEYLLGRRRRHCPAGEGDGGEGEGCSLHSFILTKTKASASSGNNTNLSPTGPDELFIPLVLNISRLKQGQPYRVDVLVDINHEQELTTTTTLFQSTATKTNPTTTTASTTNHITTNMTTLPYTSSTKYRVISISNLTIHNISNFYLGNQEQHRKQLQELALNSDDRSSLVQQ